jgi:predicted site-specific integrase-resolvase
MKKTKSAEAPMTMKNGVRVSDVAKRFNITMRTLNRWVHMGLWTQKVGKFRYTTEEKLAEFMRNQDAQKTA